MCVCVCVCIAVCVDSQSSPGQILTAYRGSLLKGTSAVYTKTAPPVLALSSTNTQPRCVITKSVVKSRLLVSSDKFEFAASRSSGVWALTLSSTSLVLNIKLPFWGKQLVATSLFQIPFV